jgi:hypothetical protein
MPSLPFIRISQLAVQMLDVGLVHTGWPMPLDEFGDTEEPLPHVGRQFVEFSLDTTVEDLHAPRHMLDYISKMRW